MSKNATGRHRLCRTLGSCIWGDPKCPSLRRAYPPGSHGPKQQRRKTSDFGLQLREKQKLRTYYGLREAQFFNTYSKALHLKGNTGENLLALLERRVDVAVYRLYLAPTLPAARQLVLHGHVLVNGKKVDKPNYTLKPGDKVTVKDKTKVKEFVKQVVENHAGSPPSYYAFDPGLPGGSLTSVPRREDMPLQVQEQMIVEFYSR